MNFVVHVPFLIFFCKWLQFFRTTACQLYFDSTKIFLTHLCFRLIFYTHTGCSQPKSIVIIYFFFWRTFNFSHVFFGMITRNIYKLSMYVGEKKLFVFFFNAVIWWGGWWCLKSWNKLCYLLLAHIFLIKFVLTE